MLSARLETMREKTRERFYNSRRIPALLEEEVDLSGLSPCAAAAELFARRCAREEPTIFPGEKFCFTRSQGKISYGKYRIENLTADWELLLTQGVAGRMAAAETKLASVAPDSAEADFLRSSLRMMAAALELADRYAEAAEKAGETEVAAVMRQVPRRPAQSFREALQSLFFMF